MSARRAGPLALAAVGLGLVLATGAAGQASLERVEQLTRLGRPEEARALLSEWWDAGRESASRRDLQRGLWLRGRLTVDPDQAELDYQRLIVLYPRGPYTPDAIFRLAQAAYARGDEATARGYVETLARDYRTADARERAEAWLAAAGPAPSAPEEQPDPRAVRPVGQPTPVDPQGDPPTAGAGTYYVQLGAFLEEERAMALYEEVRATGVEVRVVRVEGSRFVHVRFGRFVERADAVEQLERLGQAGVSAALVRDERAEELIRR